MVLGWHTWPSFNGQYPLTCLRYFFLGTLNDHSNRIVGFSGSVCLTEIFLKNIWLKSLK